MPCFCALSKKYFVGFCRNRCIVGHTKKKEGDSPDTFRGDCSPQVWLCAIAKRLWYKELERRSRTAPLEEEHLSSLTAPDDPAGEAEQLEDRMALYRSLRQLDPETREVIYLRLAGEFSFREVGELMGQSEVWARVRFYRGKERLAKLMTGGKPNG